MSATEQPGWPKFVEVVGSVFRQWTAFHLAVEQQWGGLSSGQKGEKMLHDALTFFAQSTPQDPVYADELSDFFEDTLVESFACDAEDGSCREVAEAIVRQFTMCVVNGTFAEADQIIAQAPEAAARALQQSQTVPDDESASLPESAEASMDESAGPVLDEDGFQMVVGKSNRRQQQVHEAAQAPQAQADVAAVQEAQAHRQAQLAQQQHALETQRQQELIAQQQQQQQAQQQMVYAQQQQQLLQQQQQQQQEEEAARAMAAQAQAEAEAEMQRQRVLDEI